IERYLTQVLAIVRRLDGAAQSELTAVQLMFSEQRSKQCRLAGTVRADQTHCLTSRQHDIEIIDEISSGDPDCCMLGNQHLITTAFSEIESQRHRSVTTDW